MWKHASPKSKLNLAIEAAKKLNPTVYVVEPLGRVLSDDVSTECYLGRAVLLRKRLHGLQGITVIPAPVRLLEATPAYFKEEHYGLIHLNSKGIGALCTSYKDVIVHGDRHVRGNMQFSSTNTGMKYNHNTAQNVSALVTAPAESSSKGQTVSFAPSTPNFNSSFDVSKIIAGLQGLQTIAGLAEYLSIAERKSASS